MKKKSTATNEWRALSLDARQTNIPELVVSIYGKSQLRPQANNVPALTSGWLAFSRRRVQKVFVTIFQKRLDRRNFRPYVYAYMYVPKKRKKVCVNTFLKLVLLPVLIHMAVQKYLIKLDTPLETYLGPKFDSWESVVNSEMRNGQ